MFNETAYDLAIGAGCSPSGATTAAAIAQAESSGNPSAYNGVGKDNSYGLWQINMIGNLGPARRAQFGLSSNAQLLDPATNARAMYAVSNGCTSFSPWSTFTSGVYQRFLQAFSGGSPSPNNSIMPVDSTGSTGDSSNVLDFSGGGTTDQTATDFLSGLPGGGLAVLALLAAAYFILR